MVEDDRVKIPTVVVCDEIFRGVGSLQTARSDTLMLQQRLIQRKQNLQAKRSK